MFICGECHEEADLEGFLSNVTFTEPIGCVQCGFEINIWDFECSSCQTAYGTDAWAEYIAFLFDVGEYAHAPLRIDAFIILINNILQENDTYRKNYQRYLNEIINLCFMCGADPDDCTCHPRDAFTLQDYFFVPDNIKDFAFYHSVLTLPNSKYAESCYNCTKQYTTKCEKLPEQLLTIGLNHQPAYKLDTCEYIDTSVDIKHILPDDSAPF